MAIIRLVRRQRGVKFHVWQADLKMMFLTCSAPYNEAPGYLEAKRRTFRRVRKIVKAARDDILALLNKKYLLWSALGLSCYFCLLLTGHERRTEMLSRRSEANRSLRLYGVIVQRLLQSSSDFEIIQIILDYIAHFKLWVREFLCIVMLVRPLLAGAAGATMLTLLLNQLQKAVAQRSQDGRHIMRVLYDVLDRYYWEPLDDTAAKVITRLLRMYRTFVYLEHYEDFPRDVKDGPLRKGLEVAIRHVIEHMDNSDVMIIIAYMVQWVFDSRLSDATILDFGTVLEHAALVHCTALYRDSFTHELFRTLLEIVASPRVVVSHLGHRILQQLLDRHDNQPHFDTPKIFFQNMHYQVLGSTFYSEDKVFLKRHRTNIHNCIIKAIVNHATSRLILENTFTTLCIIAAEVPCGYTAAVIANLLMHIQELARRDTFFKPQIQYHLHAFVLSIMSLLCWLHDAAEFYKYVNRIINLRAEQAPHLNPPLRIVYSFAQHHVLWDKQELFFDDWEVRYSLWMRFKTKQIDNLQVSQRGVPVAFPRMGNAAPRGAAGEGQEAKSARRRRRRWHRAKPEPEICSADVSELPQFLGEREQRKCEERRSSPSNITMSSKRPLGSRSSTGSMASAQKADNKAP